MSPSFLEIKGLTKNFGGLRAVNHVSFSMERDQVLGLIGPNGAGKTTLLRLITGILKPDHGSIRFMGEELVGRKTWDIVNMGIACTFQNMRPFRRLPIIANVMVSCLSPRAKKRGEWVKRVQAKAMDALEFAGISDMARENASTLSQGDLKRLEVARAVATEPELLLLDEPFGGRGHGAAARRLRLPPHRVRADRCPAGAGGDRVHGPRGAEPHHPDSPPLHAGGTGAGRLPLQRVVGLPLGVPGAGRRRECRARPGGRGEDGRLRRGGPRPR